MSDARKNAKGHPVRVKPDLPIERKKYLEKRYGKDYANKMSEKNKTKLRIS